MNPLTTEPEGDEGKALRAALQRAMPITRMLDYGMTYHDAVTIHRETDRGIAWDIVATRLAEEHRARAVHAVENRQIETAVQEFRLAAVDFNFAQLAYNADIGRKRELYGKMTESFARAAELDVRLAVEHIRLPYAGALIAGWLVRPRSTDKPPTVMIVGGQSGWGPAYFSAAQALSDRGIATMLVEMPGQGETRLQHGLYLDSEVPEALSAVISYLRTRDDLGHGVGVWGNSFGGLPAALVAARDPRVGGCCINGAWAQPVISPFRTAAEQAFAMVGSLDPTQVIEVFQALAFKVGHDKISCPVLVLHGGNDSLITRDDQQPFLDGAENSSIKMWEDGEHTIYNHCLERNSLVADWFSDSLVRELH